MQKMISYDGVTKIKHKTTDDPSKILAIIGGSGSGKTN